MMTAGPFGGPMSGNDGPMGGHRMSNNDVDMGRGPSSRESKDIVCFETFLSTFLPLFFSPIKV